jgi:hypothetical protein
MCKMTTEFKTAFSLPGKLPAMPSERGVGRLRPDLPQHFHGILEQLLIGSTDITASRSLDVSPRTFSRRVAELLDYLQVQTRFQCGIQVVSLNWVAPTREGEWTLPV